MQSNLLIATLIASFISASALADVQSTSLIQHRIDVAAPGDEVVVEPGIYHGTLQIKDGVFVRGAGEGEVTLDGQGAPQVVQLGKESAIAGFTIRNGGTLVANQGTFGGVFECTLESFGAFAIMLQGGSGVVAHNQIKGEAGRVAVLNMAANALIVNNVIEGNRVGVQIHPQLIPTLSDNLFRNNETAIEVVGEAKAILERNLFYQNGRATSQEGLLAGSNTLVEEDPGAFILQRGADSALYRDLMNETYAAAVTDHPLVIYDLLDEAGAFDVIGLFPWANFSLSASTLDTAIERYHAYDIVEDQPLNAEYFLQNNQRPSVKVHNPELMEKMRERYVLENRYVHGPSYFDNAEGLRVFKRLTNVSQIEVVIPAGYELVSSKPEGVLRDGFERPYLSINDIGDTHLEIVMRRNALP
ncbi:MAG: right-handed parallel beta-helix repeat-containing protein [Kiritimatiellia bacterium]